MEKNHTPVLAGVGGAASQRRQLTRGPAERPAIAPPATLRRVVGGLLPFSLSDKARTETSRSTPVLVDVAVKNDDGKNSSEVRLALDDADEPPRAISVFAALVLLIGSIHLALLQYSLRRRAWGRIYSLGKRRLPPPGLAIGPIRKAPQGRWNGGGCISCLFSTTRSSF
jgi:hypothetical protein